MQRNFFYILHILSFFFFTACANIPKAELVTSPSPALSGKDRQIVDVRSGLQSCRGALIAVKRVLVPESCIFANKGILVRSLARKDIESGARVIASMEGVVLLATDESLDEPSLTFAGAGVKESAFVQVDGTWYKIPKEFFKIESNPRVGEPVFNDKGELIGNLGQGLITIQVPKSDKNLAKDQTFDAPTLDPFRFQFGIGLPKIAWLVSDEPLRSKAYASSRLFLGVSSGSFSVRGGFEFLNIYLGKYAELRYTHIFVNKIDDPKRILSLAVGTVAVKPRALGTDVAENGTQVSASLEWGWVPMIEYSWIKTPTRQLNEFSISPLTSFF